MARKEEKFTPPKFLVDLLDARSPSGYEHEAQAVWDRHVSPHADATAIDAMGNRISTLNSEGSPVVMLAGHLDELGFLITHIDRRGFLYFQPIGGHDRMLIPGRRVLIQTARGVVPGVTGKRAIHLMDDADRKKVPEFHEMWIDIGARDKKDAHRRVELGDVATYDTGFSSLGGSLVTGRALDNRVGAYVVGEVLRRCRQRPRRLKARLVCVGTTQEEIGARGAIPATLAVKPDFGIAVDVTHATDHPDVDARRFGEYTLGGGPVITRGPNASPAVVKKLFAAAKARDITLQVEAEPRPTSTDGRMIQISGTGVPTGVISIPLRYMHTPCEVVDLRDVEQTVELLEAFVRGL